MNATTDRALCVCQDRMPLVIDDLWVALTWFSDCGIHNPWLELYHFVVGLHLHKRQNREYCLRLIVYVDSFVVIPFLLSLWQRHSGDLTTKSPSPQGRECCSKLHLLASGNQSTKRENSTFKLLSSAAIIAQAWQGVRQISHLTVLLCISNCISQGAQNPAVPPPCQHW